MPAAATPPRSPATSATTTRSTVRSSSFAVAYADQNDADYAEFTDAADEQRIAVERGV